MSQDNKNKKEKQKPQVIYVKRIKKKVPDLATLDMSAFKQTYWI